MSSPIRAFIALGANLKDPQKQIRLGLEQLAAITDSRITRISSFYRTAPLDVGDTTPHPDYINAVAELETLLPPQTLLDILQTIEQQQGRSRDIWPSPRTLDLDLLLYGDAIINTKKLVTPHPRMHLRAFVLVPLTEIAPDVLIPGLGTASDFLPSVAGQSIEKIACAPNNCGDTSLPHPAG